MSSQYVTSQPTILAQGTEYGASSLMNYQPQSDETNQLPSLMEKRINECSYDDPNITPQDKEVI